MRRQKWAWIWGDASFCPFCAINIVIPYIDCPSLRSRRTVVTVGQHADIRIHTYGCTDTRTKEFFAFFRNLSNFQPHDAHTHTQNERRQNLTAEQTRTDHSTTLQQPWSPLFGRLLQRRLLHRTVLCTRWTFFNTRVPVAIR